MVARLALVLLGTIGGLLVADFGLGFAEPPRLLGKRQLLPNNQPFGFHCYPHNLHGELAPAPKPSSGWRLFDVTVPPTPLPLERLTETPWCVKYELTEQGLRDRIYPPQPATGTVRILGIGDSFAIGEGVPQDRTVFAQLGAELGPGVEVLNAGRSGYGTARELKLMRKMIPELHPHLVLVVWLLNDIRLNKRLRGQRRWINDLVNVREAQLWRDNARPWWHRSRLLRWLDSWHRMREITAQTVLGYQQAWSREHNAGNIDRFAADLQAMREIKGVKVALVLYPMLVQLDDYPFTKIHARVATIATRANIPVLDLAPTFAGMELADLHVHPTDHHPNGKAHAIAASAISDWLRSSRAFGLE